MIDDEIMVAYANSLKSFIVPDIRHESFCSLVLIDLLLEALLKLNNEIRCNSEYFINTTFNDLENIFMEHANTINIKNWAKFILIYSIAIDKIYITKSLNNDGLLNKINSSVEYFNKDEIPKLKEILKKNYFKTTEFEKKQILDTECDIYLEFIKKFLKLEDKKILTHLTKIIRIYLQISWKKASSIVGTNRNDANMQ